MIVSELIEKLKAMPQDLPVYEVIARDSRFYPIHTKPRVSYQYDHEEKKYVDFCIIGRGIP